MQFIDTLRLYARGGRGGDGCLSFRREKYVEFGGPDGGSGGHGGSVYLEADPNLSTLLDLAAHPHRVAEDGKGGKGSDQTGARGADLVVRVPLGTMVLRDGCPIADLTQPRQRALVAKGGRGGRGNAAFKSNRDKAPRIRERGEPGESAALDLELRLLADAGLVGFPNAGKSTFLAAVSNARPKIADYPFTTLAPSLGVVRRRGRSFVLADIPGLIEGAHQGKGLGDEFLRHLARTRVLVHLVDPFGFKGLDPAATLRAIERELAAYSPDLKDRPRLLAVTKMDLTGAEAIAEKLRRRFRTRRLYAVSAATGKGMAALLDAVSRVLEQSPPAAPSPLPVAEGGRRPGEGPSRLFTVQKEGGVFVVRGEEVERLTQMTDFALPRAVARVMGVLKKMGVERALLRSGILPGDTVRIGGSELEWMDEAAAAPQRTLARRRKSYRAGPPRPE